MQTLGLGFDDSQREPPKVKVLYYIFSVGYLALTVAGLIVMTLRGRPF